MVRFCFRYEIYGYEIYGRRCEIYGSLRDLWEGLRDLWEFARFMGVTRFMGRTASNVAAKKQPWVKAFHFALWSRKDLRFFFLEG